MCNNISQLLLRDECMYIKDVLIFVALIFSLSEQALRYEKCMHLDILPECV